MTPDTDLIEVMTDDTPTLTSDPDLTVEEFASIGKNCRDADDGNMLVGSFAAELIGESYPFSKAMAKIIFDGFSDEQLGRRFVAWCDAKHPQKHEPSPSEEAVDVEGLVERLTNKQHCNDWYLRNEAAEALKRLEQERDKEVYSRVEHWRSSVEALQDERDELAERTIELAAERDALSAQVQRLREALEEIAKQKISDEWEGEGGDVEYGYDTIILAARAALGEA